VEGRAAAEGCCPVEGCVDGLAAGCCDVDGRFAGWVEGLAVELLFLELLPVLMLLDRSILTLTLLILRLGALMLVGAR